MRNHSEIEPHEVEGFYPMNVCPAYSGSSHVPLYKLNGEPLTPFPRNMRHNLRARICAQCSSLYFEQAYDDGP